MKKSLFALLFSTAGLLAQDKVKFAAKIENRNSDTLRIAGRNFSKILVSKTGTFADTFEAPAGFYQLGDGAEVTSLYLMPGYDISLKMDAKQFDESIVYTGKGAKENNVLAWLALEQEKLGESIQSGDGAKARSAVAALIAGANSKVEDKEIDEAFRKEIKGGVAQMQGQIDQMLAAQEASSKMTGAPSPAFDFENHKGGKTKLADLKGKYVYIDVWATWCGPCRAEIPHLKKAEEKYHGKNIEFVSISVDEPKAYDKWKKFVVDQKLGGIQLIADKNWQSDFIQAFGINAIPRFILIGPDGKVVNADAPRPSDPGLIATLDGLVK